VEGQIQATRDIENAQQQAPDETAYAPCRKGINQMRDSYQNDEPTDANGNGDTRRKRQ
jgi:hypothetical protein